MQNHVKSLVELILGPEIAGEHGFLLAGSSARALFIRFLVMHE